MRAARGADGAAEVCDRREGQTTQPADLSRERNTQPERRVQPCASLSVRRGGAAPSRARNGAEAGGLR